MGIKEKIWALMRSLLSVLMILVITLFTIEAVSLVYWSMQWGKVQEAEHYYKTIYTVGSECPWASMISIHPYLALRYHRRPPCNNKFANMRGMIGEEIPNSKDPNFYNILMLGGSVAEGLYLSGELERQFNENFVSPNGKPFKIWNSSLTAGAQPRQSIANLMFGEIADLVVSLEGFNEHFLFKDQFRLEVPPQTWFELEKLTTSNQSLNYIISSSVKKLALSIAADPWLKRSYSLATFIDLTLRVNRKTLKTRDENVVLVQSESGGNSQAQFISEYARYLKAMDDISRARNQKLVVFLQPIPALFKPLTDSDRRLALKLDNGESYLKMVKGIKSSVSPKMQLIPILDTFADYKDDLYVDLIHFLPDSKGNEWLARRIIKEITPILNLKTKK